MSNHDNFNYAFPSISFNPFSLNSNLNESGLTNPLLRRATNRNTGHNENDLSQFTYEQRRTNLSPYLLQLQNIGDNLPPQYQPGFHEADVTETKPNPSLTATSTMDRLPPIPNPYGSSSLNQVPGFHGAEADVTETKPTPSLTATSTMDRLPPITNPYGSSGLNQVPGFHGADVTIFDRANGPVVQPHVPRGDSLIRPSVPTSANRNNRNGARRDERLISPLPLSVHCPSDAGAKTSNLDDDSNKIQIRHVSPVNSSRHPILTPQEAPHIQRSSSGPAIVNIPNDQNEDQIGRIKNDGRIHSLPHKKNGPYYCPFPECKGFVFRTAQTFGAHTRTYHYSGETIEEKKRRETKRYGAAKNKLSLACTADGITVMPNSLNYKPVKVGSMQKNARGKERIGVQIKDYPQRFAQYEAAIKQENIKRKPM